MISPLWSHAGAALGCVLLGGGVGLVVGWVRGYRAGRAVEAMEPPKHGAWHFRDGPICEYRADSPFDALHQLTTTTRKRS